jgi:hypothetical protein
MAQFWSFEETLALLGALIAAGIAYKFFKATMLVQDAAAATRYNGVDRCRPPCPGGPHAGRALRYTPFGEKRDKGEGAADRARRATDAPIATDVAGRCHIRGAQHVVIAARAV